MRIWQAQSELRSPQAELQRPAAGLQSIRVIAAATIAGIRRLSFGVFIGSSFLRCSGDPANRRREFAQVAITLSEHDVPAI